MGEEHAADARVDRADHEGQDLVAVDIDADRLGGDLASLQRQQRASQAGAKDVGGAEMAHVRDAGDEPEILPRSHFTSVRQGRRRDRHDSHRPAGEAPPVARHLGHEAERNRHYRKVGTPRAQ